MDKAIPKEKLSHTTTKKTKKTTKKRPLLRKSSPWLEDYFDGFSFQMVPMTEAGIDRIAKEFIEWAFKTEKAIRVSQFFTQKRIPTTTYESWFRKYEVMKQAREIVLPLMAERREERTLNRKYDASTNNYMMHQYDPAWKAAQEYHAALRENNKPGAGTVNVYLDKYPSSDLVPERPSRGPEEIAAEASMRNKSQAKLDKS